MVIDVSIHNGGIDWAKVKASGVDGAIIRCGYGRDMTKQDDARFKSNIEGALAQGLRVGVYIYSYAKTEDSARSEANHVLRLIYPYKEKLSLPIYYDLEEQGTEKGAKERAVIFGDIIEKAGFWCGIYASLSWWTTHLSGLDRFTKWVAAWGSNNGKPNIKPSIKGLDLWQYTSKGKVDGINGFVDLNELLNPNIGGYIKANKPITSEKPSEPIVTTPEPPIEEPKYTLYKIKKGDTLGKIAKKYGTTTKALKVANPDKIKDVNKIYAGDTIKIPE
jgi:lysozyme